MLTIYEWLTEDGKRETVDLCADEAPDDAPGADDDAVGFMVRVGSEPPVRLPIVALERVMERYGKPLADGVALDGPGAASLTLGPLGEGGVLYRIRHLARYDVIGKDFIVWKSGPSSEPVAELATAVSAALVHLARAAAAAALQKTSNL